jgi:thiol-disulfide isomerase/thioredoxin
MILKRKFISLLLAINILFASGLNSPSLAQQVIGHGDMYFVTISAKWCFACRLLMPIVDELKNFYGNQVTFIDLDVTDDVSTIASEELAKQYGVQSFFAERRAFPTVGIFCSSSSQPEKTIIGFNKRALFEEALNNIISDAGNKKCLLSSYPVVKNDPVRPEEPIFTEISGDRPTEPELSLRPDEAGFLERPKELKFWSYGDPVPFDQEHFYLTLTIPQCANGKNVICTQLQSRSNQTRSSQEVNKSK